MAEAAHVQAALRGRVVIRDGFIAGLESVRRVAGLDAAYDRPGGTMRAAAALLSFPELEPLESAAVEVAAPFPYVPGYLSFREAPGLLMALEKLRAAPDLLVCDGHGLAHPRRLGLACHVGVLTGIPCVGVAKTRLVGEFNPPGPQRGAASPLVHEGQEVGMAVRTRAGVKPVFVSVGHLVCLDTAVAAALALCPRYRLPEPIRRAHRLASGPG